MQGETPRPPTSPHVPTTYIPLALPSYPVLPRAEHHTGRTHYIELRTHYLVLSITYVLVGVDVPLHYIHYYQYWYSLGVGDTTLVGDYYTYLCTT